MSRFLCLWWPDFAAWAAQRSDPALQGRVVMIHQRGAIVAASLAAYQAGAQLGWTLHRAKAQLQQLVPDAVFLPLHGPTLHSAWNDVIQTFLDFTPCLETPFPGLLVADVRPARAVLPLLRAWRAQDASVRAGVAEDRSTAELAAFTATSGTLRSVRPGHSAAFLKGVPWASLASLSTVCPAASWRHSFLRADTIQRLEWFGWRMVGDVAHLSKRQLTAQFDQGDLLFRYAQAQDRHPVGFYRQPPVSSASFHFEQAVREPYEWEAVLGWLIEQSLAKLQEGLLRQGAQRLGAQSLVLAVDTGPKVRRAHRLLHTLTNEKRIFFELARRMMQEELGGASFFQLTVQLRELQALPVEQGSLFAARRPSTRIAIQAMQERFPGTLQRIVMLDRHAYLPEEAFRLEAVTLEEKNTHSPKRAPRKAPRKAPQTARRLTTAKSVRKARR